MADETEISTPVEASDVETSSSLEPETVETEVETVEDTPSEEPTSQDETAETETQAPVQEKLYAGKYKSVEELEKGYGEAQKFIAKASEFEKKYNELAQQKQNELLKAQEEQLKLAQQRGFNTIEDQEIALKGQLAEFEYYANNINSINPEYTEAVRSNLLQYYQTGNNAYLEEAKRYFPSSFIERVALEKQKIENSLRGEFETRKSQEKDRKEQELANVLKTQYADFLGDIQTNSPKARALKAFCNVGSIQTVEDMKVFQDIYSSIVEQAKNDAVKEYLAQQAINETKAKANFDNGDAISVDTDKMPTYAEIEKMTQKQYEKAYAKWGNALYSVK